MQTNEKAVHPASAPTKPPDLIITPAGWRDHINRYVTAAIRHEWAVTVSHGVAHVDGVWECTCRRDCGRPGKHPYGATWDDATCTTMDEWDKSSRRNVFPNYAIRLELCGLVATDIDHHPNGPNGVVEWRRLCDGHQMPDTFRVISGSRAGEHWLWQREEWMSKTILAPGVELLTKAITGPGSRHISGNTYAILDNSEPAKMPEWMSDEFKRRVEPESRIERMTDGDPRLDHLRQISESGLSDGQYRNGAAARLYGYLISHRVDPYVARQMMQHWNAANIEPLEQNRLEAAMTSVLRAELRKRGGRAHE